VYAGKKLEQLFLGLLRETVELFPAERRDALSEALSHLLAVVCIVLSADPKIRPEELIHFFQDIRSEFQLIITPSIIALPGPLAKMRDQALKRLTELPSSTSRLCFQRPWTVCFCFSSAWAGKGL